MPDFETQFQNFELQPNTKMQVVAVLENKYFLKTEQGQYFFLNLEKEQAEGVSEAAVASAILKHGYKPKATGQVFEFGQRKEVLK